MNHANINLYICYINHVNSTHFFYYTRTKWYVHVMHATEKGWANQWKMNKSSATHFDTINATTRPCSELWLVERCLHIDLPSPLHQPQLATWRVVSFVMPKCVALDLFMKNVWPLFTNNPNLEPKITLVTITSRDVASFQLGGAMAPPKFFF